jgi:hypothetical protein
MYMYKEGYISHFSGRSVKMQRFKTKNQGDTPIKIRVSLKNQHTCDNPVMGPKIQHLDNQITR